MKLMVCTIDHMKELTTKYTHTIMPQLRKGLLCIRGRGEPKEINYYARVEHVFEKITR